MKADKLYDRYQRQIILHQFGIEAQQKLLGSRVLVVGVGGLGCPVLQYLVAAGVGTISIIDDDVVNLSNLHRQVLYGVDDIGLPKVEKAKAVLQKLNPDINILVYKERLTTENAFAIISLSEIVVDGTDNFSTRYLINDACVLLKRPLVFGAISQWEGQVAVFNVASLPNEEAVNYRDLFPQPPKDDEVKNCAEAGVLGVLPGIIGTMMAAETIKLITGIGTSLSNRMLMYNALHHQSYEIKLAPQADTRSLIPATEAAFRLMNYEALCTPGIEPFEIDASRFTELIKQKNITVIDVREKGELPAITEFKHWHIPLSDLKDKHQQVKSAEVILFCQSGKRSLQAAKLLAPIFGSAKKVYSLKGGIIQWKNAVK